MTPAQHAPASSAIPGPGPDPGPANPARAGQAASHTDPAARTAAARPHRPPRLPAVSIILLAAFVLAAHIWSIDVGLFLDDHAHFRQLRDSGWAPPDMVDAARLGIVGDVLRFWGQTEAGLRFFRPVAFYILKLEYALAGWQPWAVHLGSLLWHFACVLLVAALALRALGDRAWATVAGAWMAAHPGHVVTVYWIACQTELIVTAFALLAVICYARASGWPFAFATRTPAPSDVLPHRRMPWFCAAAICFALATGCRENAVIIPVVLALGDLVLCRRLFWKRYALFALIIAAYLALRLAALGGFPLPGRPYLVHPADPGFFAFLVHKALYLTLGLFAYVPIIPVAGQEYFQARPLALYGGVALIVAGMLAMWLRAGRPHGWLWPAMWVPLTMLPLLPVFASPHHLYLPAVGGAILFAASLQALAAAGARLPAHRSRTRGAALLIVALHAALLPFGAWAIGWAFRAGTAVEDQMLEDLLADAAAARSHTAALHRPIRDGDTLYFINFPIVGYYLVPALETRLGLHDLQGHALTFSPSPLRMFHRSTVRVLDQRTIEVTTHDARYLTGTAGRVICQAMGLPWPVRTGSLFNADGYTVEVLEADETGIRRLRFRFDRPLTAPGRHVFISTPTRYLYRLLLTP